MLPRSHDHSDIIGVDLLPQSQAFRVFMQDGSGGQVGKVTSLFLGCSVLTPYRVMLTVLPYKILKCRADIYTPFYCFLKNKD